MRRTYKLADPVRPGGYPGWQDIIEVAGDGRKVILTVPETSALNVLGVLQGVYEHGREDNAPHFHGSGYGEPCWCPSPLTYAPQGRTEYGSGEDEAEPITDVDRTWCAPSVTPPLMRLLGRLALPAGPARP